MGLSRFFVSGGLDSKLGGLWDHSQFYTVQIPSSDCASVTSNRSVSVTEKRQSIEPVENTKRAAGIGPEERETKNPISSNKMLLLHSLGNPAR